ncbi:MAG: hypothetical protein RLP44_26785 [Aggregatilineales bacterium]
MRENLLTPLQDINHTCEVLLSETELDFMNEQIVQSIYHVAQLLTELVISVTDFTGDKAREVFSFESRSHLASIIGYAEVLLDDDDALLKPPQIDLIQQIRDSGKILLTQLTLLEN